MLFKNPCDEGVIRTKRSTARATRRGAWVLGATILGSSIAFIDGTVVSIALPALQRSFGATVSDVQWIVEAYALPFAALLLVGGAMGDRFGRRLVFAIGIALFAAASVGCGFARSVPWLIVARAVQGVGAAMLVPGSLALIAASFPESERGPAIGLWSGFSGMTTALGPVLGGWLIDHLSWRWAFFVNVPIALVTMAILLWRVPESRDEHAPDRLDLLGATLTTVGLGGLVFGLVESTPRGWEDPAVLGAITIGIGALAGFLGVEVRSRSPMIPPSLFRSRRFTGANLMTLALYGGLSAFLFVLPLDLIQVQRYSAARAGAALLPPIMIMLLLSRWSGGLIDRVGPRLPLVAGPLIAGLGFALLARAGVGSGYAGTYLPGLLVLGLGMAITVAPLTTTVMTSVEVAHAGVASGVNNAVSRTAGLMAIALLTLPLLHVFTTELMHRLAVSGIRPELMSEVHSRVSMLANLRAPSGASESEAATIQAAVAESFSSAVRVILFASAGLAALAAGIAAATIDGGRRRVERA